MNILGLISQLIGIKTLRLTIYTCHKIETQPSQTQNAKQRKPSHTAQSPITPKPNHRNCQSNFWYFLSPTIKESERDNRVERNKRDMRVRVEERELGCGCVFVIFCEQYYLFLLRVSIE